MMGAAPILYCGIAAWLFSNQQVFKNHYNLADPKHLFPASDHSFSQIFTQKNLGTIFWILPVIVLVILYGVIL